MEIKKSLNTALFSTPLLCVLDFLLQHPDEELNDTEIAGQIDTVKKSAVNNALRELAEHGVIERHSRGKMMFNRLVDSPLTTQFKILSSLLLLQPLIDELKSLCTKIVLFGSRADGSYHSASDFDLLAVSKNGTQILRGVRKSELSDKLQIIVKSPEDMLTCERDEPLLFDQMSKGIVLWQRM